MTLSEQLKKAKSASYRLAAAGAELRNSALGNIKKALNENLSGILEANKSDLETAEKSGLAGSLYKRLVLNEKKISDLCQGIDDLIRAEDPLSVTDMKRELDKGLVLYRKRVPVGLIGVVFESRPDAFVQISSLCLKSGNAAILKGGREAANTVRTLHKILAEALLKTDQSLADINILVETREEIHDMLSYDRYIDLIIPRGSNQLVRYIKENTKIPVLGHADGICHMYIDKDSDLRMAADLVYDAKCQYPAVCNAIETLLVHKDIASEYLPVICSRLNEVELRGDASALKIVNMGSARDDDWSAEYNDMILSVRIVDDIEQAVEHINNYGSHHTDAIVSENKKAADYFITNVDSSSVMHNCSTRFADGFRYGFGAEVGISTNKIHARGPVGMEGLTIYKYILTGHGETVAPYADGSRKFIHKDLL